MPHPGGRPLDFVWLYYVRTEEPDGVKATCKGCGVAVLSVVCKLWAHARSCEDLRGMGYEVTPATDGESQSEIGGSSAASCVSDGASSSNALPAVKKRRLMQAQLHPVVTDGPTKRLLDEQLTRFVVAANLPFRCVSHPELKAFVDLCRPGYHLPERRTVAGELLDAVYNKELRRITAQFVGSYATLQMDGWSSPSSDPVLATAVCVGQRSFLLSAEDTNGQPHTAEWLAERLITSIDLAETELKVHIIAVATDSASNMKRMKELVQERRSDLLYVPCMAHWMNLAAKDIAEDNPVLEKVCSQRWAQKSTTTPFASPRIPDCSLKIALFTPDCRL